MVFEGTGVSITKEGKQHLGAEVKHSKKPTSKRKLQHGFRTADYSCRNAPYAHSLAAKWNYLSQTVPDTGDLFQPLEDIIRKRFLPTLTGQNTFSDTFQDLIVLPARLGGL